MADELGLWTYGVLRAGATPPTGVNSVDAEHPIETVESGELAALVSRVPLAEFGAEPLRRNLNDLGWLERVARAHEEVLDRALESATVVPLRLCTIYESPERVREMLVAELAAFADALDLLDGRHEWGVKLLVDPERLTQAARAGSEEDEAQVSTQSEGGAYMLRRRLERQVKQRADALAADIATEVHARLQDWATAAVTRPPQNRELSRHDGEMLLNGAYLVDAGRADGLRALVAELEQQHRELGARLELTGPWPPYSFVPRGGEAAIA